MLKTMLNRIEHNKNALKTKRYYVEDLISNEELIILVEEIERLNNIINKAIEYINKSSYRTQWGDLDQDNEDININEDLTEKEFIENLLEILDKAGDEK